MMKRIFDGTLSLKFMYVHSFSSFFFFFFFMVFIMWLTRTHAQERTRYVVVPAPPSQKKKDASGSHSHGGRRSMDSSGGGRHGSLPDKFLVTSQDPTSSRRLDFSSDSMREPKKRGACLSLFLLLHFLRLLLH